MKGVPEALKGDDAGTRGETEAEGMKGNASGFSAAILSGQRHL